ncbi:unnamed protein product, partial [Rotaria sp. Silwood2]
MSDVHVPFNFASADEVAVGGLRRLDCGR